MLATAKAKIKKTMTTGLAKATGNMLSASQSGFAKKGN